MGVYVWVIVRVSVWGLEGIERLQSSVCSLLCVLGFVSVVG